MQVVFSELVVDNMSEKDLVRYAQEQLIDTLNHYSLEELKDDVDNFDEDLYAELVDNVTNEKDSSKDYVIRGYQ